MFREPDALRRCRARRLRVVLALAAALPALAGTQGMSDPMRDSTLHWETRLSLLPASLTRLGPAAAPRLGQMADAAVLGHYYIDRPRLGDSGGLRLTTGLIVALRERVGGQAADPGAQISDADPLLRGPYLGIGYSGASQRGGWGFAADLGWSARMPDALRLGRMAPASMPLDERWRMLRWEPVVQIGVSYAF